MTLDFESPEAYRKTIQIKSTCKDIRVGKLETETKANRHIVGAILDLTIPGGMGGKEAITEIKKISPETVVFATSGHAKDPVMSNPKEFGFADSISKPFRKSELEEMLSRHIMK